MPRAEKSLPIGMLLLRVYLPFAAAYFLSYLYRTVNAVVGPLLADELQLSAGDLGLLTSAYFIMFSAIQLPLGIALDRFGPRRVQTVLMLVAALGAILFGIGASMLELTLARALIGLGVAAGLMAAMKVITIWFPSGQWPLMNGLVVAAGGLGALMATAPTQAALDVMSWHSLFFALSAITVCVALLLWFVVPEKPASPVTETLSDQVRAVGQILGDRYYWRIVPLAACAQAIFIGIQSLWIGPWLRDVADQNGAERAATMLWTTVAMTAGFLTTGMVDGLLRRRGISSLTSATAAMGLFLICTGWLAAASFAMPANVPPVMLWCAFGFLGPYALLYYPVLTTAFPVDLAGRVSTSVNFIVFGTVFLAQWGIGRVLDFWPRTAAGGYAPTGYAVAFGLLAVLQIIALLWLLTSRASPLIPPPATTTPLRP